jgi:hypothetical protein
LRVQVHKPGNYAFTDFTKFGIVPEIAALFFGTWLTRLFID